MIEGKIKFVLFVKMYIYYLLNKKKKKKSNKK